MYHRNSAAVRPRQRPLSLRSVSPRHRASVAPPPVACPPLSFSATGSGAAGGVAGEGGRETDRRRRTRGTRKRRIRSRSPPSRAHALLDRTGRSLTRPYTHTTSERGREGGGALARSSLARSLSRGAQSPSGLKHGSTACRGPQVSRRIDPPRFLKVRAPVHCADPFARR